jgi:glycosyltransferase involved in cell wall biosynthesis
MKFSVIIPAFNRPAKLKQCLDSFATLNYPRDQFEVIVVDDGSPTPLSAHIEPAAFPFQLTLTRQPNTGPGLARNLGASLAKGHWLAFTDDDCQADPNWLNELEKTFLTHGNVLLGGKVTNGLKHNLCAEANQLLSNTAVDWLATSSSPLSFTPTNNLACLKQHFLDLGGFSLNLPIAASEDRDFCMRMTAHGHPLRFAPTAIIRHFHDQNVFRFTAMHFRYGRGAAMLHTANDSNPARHARFGLYRELAASPFRHLPAPTAILTLALLAWSQFVQPLGYFYQRWSRP